MGKNNPNANPIWGVKRSKPGCLCTDGLTYSNECCEGYLWNQGISRNQGTNPFLQNLLITEPGAGNVPSVRILGTNPDGSVYSLVWQTGPN
jgi:hypothetical protein